MSIQSSISSVSLAAGLLLLADVRTIAYHTTIQGTSSFLDIFFLAPGIHQQQHAPEVSRGEYPATGAMTTGYVFRTENEATVYYLQRVGKTGHLVTIEVLPSAPNSAPSSRDTLVRMLRMAGVAFTVAVILRLYHLRDWWAVGCMTALMTARLLNVIVIKRRSKLGWKGAAEPGVQGDLLVLLSQDRWLRMQGLVDDLKTVTSGSWLREESTAESFLVTIGTLLVYASPAVAMNASPVGGSLILCVILVSLALLGLCNALADTQKMFGRTLRTVGEPKKYRRRLDLVEELVKVHGRDDWAIGMGMVTVADREKMQKATM
ncbi:hypothetical protein OE88DRAFT_1664709 [Heliocybe sulcata]|uniref:Uncharacterized protein n=1 Tax=Heliocybe sulcata TaxID=5364 RepID=A0A5C3MRW7_9AGAM|nr:hypothetical protein OE88DRAFT_1664709 [Heliocybe sulcata]